MSATKLVEVEDLRLKFIKKNCKKPKLKYYNTFNKQMLDTIKLENNNKCYYESVAYEYAGQNEKECTWTKEKNQIVISFENSDSIKIDILNNGDLLVDNTVFKKIN